MTVTLGDVVKAPEQGPVEGPVSGPTASLSRAGLEGGITLEPNRVRGNTRPVAEILGASPSEAKYVLAGEVGRGGMGVVLRAVDRDLRRDVAMKLLQSRLDGNAVERFVHEAQIAGQLEHPNIVPVHDLGVDAGGRPFFTMKLVKGRSLSELIRAAGAERDAGVLRRHLGIFINACNAIAFAHDRGVVHRDLKPANIMVGDFGEVLVMDWGLAKLTRGHSGTRWIAQPVPLGVPVSPKATDERLATLVRSFSGRTGPSEGGRTIEGTPAYMSPEQAQGYLSEIDERSDIYSLGAILYEILTGRPPVGGQELRAILDAVIAHKIIPPEERAPHRFIPPELAAIAMKALMRDKEDRYGNVLELTHDIELFLEGRTVSAKEDSTWEALVKLIRRNQEVALAIAVSSLIVVIVTVMLITALVKERHRFQDAARKAEHGLADLKREQAGRQEVLKRAAPALVAKARRGAEAGKFTEAREDVAYAITYDPTLAEAHLLSAQLAIRDKEYSFARRTLADYLRLRPEDADGILLADLTTRASEEAGSSAALTAIADVLVRQGAYTLAEGLYQNGREVVKVYQVRLEKAWPNSTRLGFSANANGQLSILGLSGRGDVADLSPLTGMPIIELKLDRTQVIDLAPLKGMPLVRLDLTDTPVRSLDPLAGAPLTHLMLANTRVDDLAPLRGAPLDELDLGKTQVMDLAPLEGCPLTVLRLGATRIADLTPLAGMRLISLAAPGTRITDLAPLANLPLTDLDIGGCNVSDLTPIGNLHLTSLRAGATRISELKPLLGMPLRFLALGRTGITDLSPLLGMPLGEIHLAGTKVSDLSPLAGSSISELDLSETAVTTLAPLARLALTRINLARTPILDLGSLAPFKLSELSLADTRVIQVGALAGMPLTSLDLSRTGVIHLDPLRQLPLNRLVLDGTRIDDIKALALMPLKELSLAGTRIDDLSPLADERGPGLRLERLVLPLAPGAAVEVLRRLPNLVALGESWDGSSWQRLPPAKIYWNSRKIPGP